MRPTGFRIAPFEPLVITVDEKHRELAGAPARVKPSVFEPVEGGYRVVSGREQGERLRVEGERLVWGGYVFTRRQETTPTP